MMDKTANDEVSVDLRMIEQKFSKKQDEGHGKKVTILKEKLEAHNHEAKNWWNTFFIISCAFAVFNDPVFCYMNAIDDEHKCITMDKKLAKKYIYTRTTTDVFYLFDVIISKCGCGCCCCCRRRGRRCCSRSCKSCLTNLLSTLSRIYVSLPIAQVLVSRTKVIPDSSNFLILTALQYILRIYYIYGSLRRRPIIDITKVERWLKPILDFVPFILASHLFGASWYLLATQRLMNCWALTGAKVCGTCSLYSYGAYFLACRESDPTKTYHEGSNISRWDDLCPVKEADPNIFDFGIFFYALQSQVVSSTHPFLQRMFQSFWWALRNLSSFGSNLNSSMDPLEIFFSVLISISGMALFLVYLNARMQESQDRLKKLILKEKTELMKPDVDLWLYKNDLPKDLKAVTRNKKDMKTVIMENIHKLEDKNDIDLDVQNMLSVLPIKDKQSITWVLFKSSLKEVPMLENINEKVLKAICQHLLPVTYREDSYIVEEGKPLGKMLLITQGIAVTYANGGTSSGSSGNEWLKKGDFYGQELLNWAFKSPSFSDLPISDRNVIAQEKVEAFAIRASDLKSVFLKFWWLFSREVDEVSQFEQWGHLAATSIQATWRHRRARTTDPTGWDRFVAN